MQGRVYICHHDIPERILTTPSFATMVSGRHDDAANGLLGDLDGENIAAPDYHSEMRHQYHVWKHRLGDQDYVGFEHYRRAFFINPFSAAQLRRLDPELMRIQRVFFSTHNVIEGCKPDLFDSYIDLRRAFPVPMKSYLDKLMTNNDIVVQRMTDWNIEANWKEHHSHPEWEVFIDSIRATRFFSDSADLIDFSLNNAFYCNMYVMRTELFREYMEFWWLIMQRISERVEVKPRSLGFFAERLINFFVYGKRLQDPSFRLATLPYMMRYFF